MTAIATISNLALAYAPAVARAPWQAVMALDARLADTALRPGEPMFRQLRLAWWRDQLSNRTEADPVLTAVHSVGLAPATLIGLVDGWEEIAVGADRAGVLQVGAAARAHLLVNLAQVLDGDLNLPAVRSAAQRWAQVDLAQRLNLPPGNTGDRAAILLPKSMRPLAILDGLARRSLARSGDQMQVGLVDVLVAIRIGLFGR